MTARLAWRGQLGAWSDPAGLGLAGSGLVTWPEVAGLEQSAAEGVKEVNELKAVEEATLAGLASLQPAA